MLEYSFKFTKFSKYAPSFVSYPRDEMNRTVVAVSGDLQEECHSAMLHDNMNISCIMVYAKQVEKGRDKRRSTNAKRAKSFDVDSSKGSLDNQDNPRFKKRFYNQVPSKFPKARDDRVSNPMPKKKWYTSKHNKKPTCAKSAKGYLEECLV